MQKITFVVNPIAGGGKDTKSLEAIVEKELPADKYDISIVRTEYAGHARDLANKALEEGSDIVVAVGGDGTVNEVGSMLVGHDNVALGIIPRGSGNGLARHCEIPMDVRKSVRLIAENHYDYVDCGEMNGHYFFATAGTGYDAVVSQKFSEIGNEDSLPNRLFGKRGILNYLRANLGLLPGYEPRCYRFKTQTGEEFEERAFLVTVGNAAQWGNNAFIAPQASIQDGNLTTAVVRPFSFWCVPAMVWRLLLRRLDQDERLRYLQTTSLEIASDEPLGWCQVDGEPIYIEEPLEFTVHHNALRLITPKERKYKL